MDERLERKLRPLEELAEDNGWVTERNYENVEGCTEAVQLVGIRTDWHPDTPSDSAVRFGFSVAFGINEHSGRAAALRLDGKANAVLIVTVEDGTNRYWYGPLNAAIHALTDPQGWTGVLAPAPSDPVSR